MAPAYALLASLAWGVGDFLGGLKSRIFPALVVMGVSQPFGLAALAIAVAVRGTAPPGPEVAWAALASVFGTLGLVAFYRGMAAGAMSVVVPLAAVASGIPVIWGLAHGDHVSFLQELGFVAALGGGLMASLERGGERCPRNLGAGRPGSPDRDGDHEREQPERLRHAHDDECGEDPALQPAHEVADAPGEAGEQRVCGSH